MQPQVTLETRLQNGNHFCSPCLRIKVDVSLEWLWWKILSVSFGSVSELYLPKNRKRKYLILSRLEFLSIHYLYNGFHSHQWKAKTKRNSRLYCKLAKPLSVIQVWHIGCKKILRHDFEGDTCSLNRTSIEKPNSV